VTNEHVEVKRKKEIPVEEITQLIDVVGDKIPTLIKSLKDLVYSPEAGKSMGQAVGNFYQELVASGIGQELASSLTREYLSTMQNFGNKFGFGHHLGGHHLGKDIRMNRAKED